LRAEEQGPLEVVARRTITIVVVAVVVVDAADRAAVAAAGNSAGSRPKHRYDKCPSLTARAFLCVDLNCNPLIF
jgi:hypothetical protein